MQPNQRLAGPEQQRLQARVRYRLADTRYWVMKEAADYATIIGYSGIAQRSGWRVKARTLCQPDVAFIYYYVTSIKARSERWHYTQSASTAFHVRRHLSVFSATSTLLRTARPCAYYIKD
ncbi:hypothetical protein R84981_002001 [Carnimonas sp. R-84981]|uniref:hypothetical protein n=1 Tax=Carnimonas bestiolae TaxID=3402172 RepID=UPI003EDBB378